MQEIQLSSPAIQASWNLDISNKRSFQNFEIIEFLISLWTDVIVDAVIIKSYGPLSLLYISPPTSPPPPTCNHGMAALHMSGPLRTETTVN